MPILDDHITPLEVEQQVKVMKSDKACGSDGVPPGIFKLLPGQWNLLLTNLFNVVFSSAMYPRAWASAKLVIVFKKEKRKDVKINRGITIMNSIAKLYDMVLYLRLKQCFNPHREQAGSQKKSSLEHITAFRLLCDMARRKKVKTVHVFC